MKFLCFQKILTSPPSSDLKSTRKKGAITIFAAFFFFVFSALGLGMFYMSRIYLNISAYKKNKIQLEYASENGIKEEFAILIQKLTGSGTPILLSELEMESLKFKRI